MNWYIGILHDTVCQSYAKKLDSNFVKIDSVPFKNRIFLIFSEWYSNHRKLYLNGYQSTILNELISYGDHKLGFNGSFQFWLIYDKKNIFILAFSMIEIQLIFKENDLSSCLYTFGIVLVVFSMTHTIFRSYLATSQLSMKKHSAKKVKLWYICI